MKNLSLFIILLLVSKVSFAQKVYQIRADSVRIYNVCDTAELILENRTQKVDGFLFNKGAGRTEFRKLKLQSLGASRIAIVGQDTLDLSALPGIGNGVDTIFSFLDSIKYIKRGVVYSFPSPEPFKYIPDNTLTLFNDYRSNAITGFFAYDTHDMPSVSDQAVVNEAGLYKYYIGHTVKYGKTGYQMAVNWNGELNGVNGVFLRTQDDTQTAWSSWRELLFKDYADAKFATKTSLTTPGAIQINWDNITNKPSFQEVDNLASVTARNNSTPARLFVHNVNQPNGEPLPPAISLAIGDHDTGLNSDGDGEITLYSNNQRIAKWTGYYFNFNIPNIFITGSAIWHAGNDGAGSGLDADLLRGMPPAVSPNLYSVAVRDGTGHLYANYYNTQATTEENVALSRLFGSYDNFIRPVDATSVKRFLGIPSNGETLASVTARSAETDSLITVKNTISSVKTVDMNNGLFAFGNYEARNNKFPSYGFHIPETRGLALYMNAAGELRTRQDNGVDGLVWRSDNDGAGSGLDANLLDGFGQSMSPVGSSIVTRDGNGYIFGTYFNTTAPTESNGTITRIFGSADNFIRPVDAGTVRRFIGSPENGETLESVTSRGNATNAGIEAGSFKLRNNSGLFDGNLLNFQSGNQHGIRFWDGNEEFSIAMSSADYMTNANPGWARISTLGSNDFNMYFRMKRLNCGFVFITGDDQAKVQIDNQGITCNQWIRTRGPAGIYFEDYGGGLFMQDNLWVRVYNNKSFYHETGIMRTDGTLQVGPGGSKLNVPSTGTPTIDNNTIYHAGNLLFSTASVANYLVQRDGNANIFANGFYQSSKASLKKDIADFNEPALPLINNVKIKQFVYKDDKEDNLRVGIIADSTDWHFATKAHDKFDTNSSLAITMKAVQELSEENRGLKHENEVLKAQLSAILKRLEILEEARKQ